MIFADQLTAAIKVCDGLPGVMGVVVALPFDEVLQRVGRSLVFFAVSGIQNLLNFILFIHDNWSIELIQSSSLLL